MNALDWANCISFYKNNILKAMGFKGDTRKEVAKYFNMSESQVHKYESLLKLIEPLRLSATLPISPLY